MLYLVLQSPKCVRNKVPRGTTPDPLLRQGELEHSQQLLHAFAPSVPWLCIQTCPNPVTKAPIAPAFFNPCVSGEFLQLTHFAEISLLKSSDCKFEKTDLFLGEQNTNKKQTREQSTKQTADGNRWNISWTIF